MALKNKKKGLSPTPLKELINKDGISVAVKGRLTSVREFKSMHKNNELAFAILADHAGSVEVIIFPSVYREVRTMIRENTSVLIQGTLRILEQDSKNGPAEGHRVIIAEKILVVE